MLRQELRELLEDGIEDSIEDAAVTCEAPSESAPTDWEIRNTMSSKKWNEARPSLIKRLLNIHIVGASVENKQL